MLGLGWGPDPELSLGSPLSHLWTQLQGTEASPPVGDTVGHHGGCIWHGLVVETVSWGRFRTGMFRGQGHRGKELGTGHRQASGKTEKERRSQTPRLPLLQALSPVGQPAPQALRALAPSSFSMVSPPPKQTAYWVPPLCTWPAGQQSRRWSSLPDPPLAVGWGLGCAAVCGLGTPTSPGPAQLHLRQHPGLDNTAVTH